MIKHTAYHLFRSFMISSVIAIHHGIKASAKFHARKERKIVRVNIIRITDKATQKSDK